MSAKVTGFNTQIVQRINNRLDQFDKSNIAYQSCQKKLDELAAKNVELVDRPAHEELYQTLLDEFKKAAETLKADAKLVRHTTNQKHIHKYFRSRRHGKINKLFEAGPKNYRYVNLGWQGYLIGIHEVAQNIIKTDYDDQVTKAKNTSQSRKTEAYSEIEFASIDQTFPSCHDRLIQENPDEYLRQAALYQDKLLETNDEAKLLAFGISWIQNLPKEATWQQVEKMSIIMLKAAKKKENVDLTEYQAEVQQWLKEHPLSENPDLVDLTPDQATSPLGQRTYILGLLYLHNQNLDPEAFQIYQSCGDLYPDQHFWKAAQTHYKLAQARYHISRFQWIEAEQSLAGLPEDDALVRDTQRYLKVAHARYHISNRQWVEAGQSLSGLPEDDASVIDSQRDLDYYLRERIYSAGMDVFVTALSKFMPSSYREKSPVDITLTALQLGTSGTVRQMWLPHVLGIPDRAISCNPWHLPWRSSLSMLGDVADCAFRNIAFLRPYQSRESFVTSTLRMAHTAKTLYENPLQRSLSAVVNLGSLCISSSQSLDACRGIRRPAGTQAFLSTLQKMASDLMFGVALIAYPDLLPVMGIRPGEIAKSIGAKSLVDRISSASSPGGEESSKDKWVLGAIGVGALATFRFYRDYSYLWAVSVMRDVEFYYSQGDQRRVEEILTEAKNSYFVSSVRPAVRDYALYAKWLKEYPMLLEDPAKCRGFRMDLDLALNILEVPDHYRGIRNNILMKKLETAIIQQDTRRLEEVFKENPDEKIVAFGFHCFLNSTFQLALGDPDEACNLLKEMGPSFPAGFHQTTASFIELLQEHSESLQEWSQLNALTGQQKRPDDTQIDRWNNALPKLQVFFSKNVGETRVLQDLQYCKLLIEFAQIDKTDITPQVCFEKSNPELHQRFFYDLVHCTRQLRKEGKHQEAISLLKRAQIQSFKYNELIQNYGDFFSLLFSSHLQRDAVLKEIQKLESSIAGLSTNDGCYQELHVFFESCKIVLSLDAGKCTNARKLLAQETTDLRVPDEVAALLFERVQASLQANRAKKGLSYLQGIAAHQRMRQSLEAVFEKFNSIRYPIPESLKGEMVNILIEIARLAGEAGQQKIGLEALEAIKQVVKPDEQLEYFIGNLKRQLNA